MIHYTGGHSGKIHSEKGFFSPEQWEGLAGEYESDVAFKKLNKEQLAKFETNKFLPYRQKIRNALVVVYSNYFIKSETFKGIVQL